MPETGTSWHRAWPAEAVQARAARDWAAQHAVHPDARQIAGELFLAVLASHPTAVQITVSTAGTRRRITAASTRPLALHSLHGTGRTIIRALAAVHGVTPDDCGLWAELPWEER